MHTYKLPPIPKKDDEEVGESPKLVNDDPYRRRICLPANEDITSSFKVGDRVIVVLVGTVNGVSSNQYEDRDNRDITVQVEQVSVDEDMADAKRLKKIMNDAFAAHY